MRALRVVPSMMAFGVAALFLGCQSTPDKPAEATEPGPAMRAAGQPIPSSTSGSAEPTDETIGFQIRRILSVDPTLSATVLVQVEDGKVTLTGTAPTSAASWKAQAAANSAAGVKSVVNQIVVTTPSTSPFVPPVTPP